LTISILKNSPCDIVVESSGRYHAAAAVADPVVIIFIFFGGEGKKYKKIYHAKLQTSTTALQGKKLAKT